MTTNLFVIANVKQLRTDGSFRILLPFFRISCGVGVLNSVIYNSFHYRVEFGTVLEDLRNFGGGEGGTTQTLPLGMPLPQFKSMPLFSHIFLQPRRHGLAFFLKKSAVERKKYL